jgi:hypothetical protein
MGFTMSTHYDLHITSGRDVSGTISAKPTGLPMTTDHIQEARRLHDWLRKTIPTKTYQEIWYLMEKDLMPYPKKPEPEIEPIPTDVVFADGSACVCDVRPRKTVSKKRFIIEPLEVERETAFEKAFGAAMKTYFKTHPYAPITIPKGSFVVQGDSHIDLRIETKEIKCPSLLTNSTNEKL